MIPTRELSALPLEAAARIGGGGRRLVLGTTRDVVRCALAAAFGPPEAPQPAHPATLTIYSTDPQG